MHYSRSESPKPRIMDHLQQQYNHQAYQNWADGKKKQNLYYKIVQMEQASLNQRRSMEKQLKQKQDSKIKEYWLAEQERVREMQRRRKEEVDNVRKVNHNMSLEIMQQSKERDQFTPHNDFNEFYRQQLQKQKKQKQQFLREGKQYQNYKKQQQKTKQMIDLQVAHLKFKQREQIQRKRQADLKRIRDKHQQNYSAYHQLDEVLRQRQAQQNLLQNYIVNKGANDQQARLLELRGQFQAKQKQRKQTYMKQLKQQLQNGTYKHIMDRKNEIENERNQIEQRNRYFSEIDKFQKLRKSQQDKKMLQTLKMQVKPRNLLPEPDKIQKVGLGSPVNIGKVVGDDRKRQLEWIQKSLLRQIHY